MIKEMRSGFFPLWNPYILCGMPVLTNVMSNIFSPLLPIFFLFKDLVSAYVVVMLTEIFLMGYCFYLMMRSVFKTHRIAAYTAAMVFIFCGFMLWIDNLSMKSIEDLFFLYPLSFIFYIKLRNNPNIKWTILLSSVLAILFINCNSAILHHSYNIFFLGLFHLWHLFFDRQPSRKEIKINILFAASIILSLGLCAFQLVPVYEAVQNSTRFTGAISYYPLKPFPIAISCIYPDIWPKFDFIRSIGGFLGLRYGVIGYFGIASLVLAIIGSCYSSNKKKWFFIIIPSVYLISWPFYTSVIIQDILPTSLKTGNHFYYSFYLASFCVAVLTGLGCNFIKENLARLKEAMLLKKRAVRIVKYTIVILLVIYLAAFIAISTLRVCGNAITPIIKEKFLQKISVNSYYQRSPEFYVDKLDYIKKVFYDNFPLFAFSNLIKLLGLIFLFIILFRNPKHKPYFFYGLIGFIVLGHISVAWQYITFLPRDYYYQETPTVKFLEQQAENDLFRAGVMFSSSELFWENHPNASFAEFLDYSQNLKGSLHEKHTNLSRNTKNRCFFVDYARIDQINILDY